MNIPTHTTMTSITITNITPPVTKSVMAMLTTLMTTTTIIHTTTTTMNTTITIVITMRIPMMDSHKWLTAASMDSILTNHL